MELIGGTTFERDLRLQAKDLGYKFTNSGLFERATERQVDVSASSVELSERRVFEVLQLPYFEPELRNTG